MDPIDEFYALGMIYCDRWYHHYDPKCVTLNEAEWTILCACEFKIETVNNGLGYENWTAPFFQHVLAALDRIGATGALALAREAYAVHRDVALALTADERDRVLTELNFRDVWEQLWVTPYAVEYLREHRHELRLSDLEAAPAEVLDGHWRQCGACLDAWKEEPEAELAKCPTCKRLTIRRAPPAVIGRWVP